MTMLRVMDERSDESLRSVIGRLLVRSERADIALARVRLAALDLTEAEVRGPARCRVLLGELDASILMDAASESRPARPGMRTLAEWLASDRMEVRSAGIGSWTPDFSVYHDADGAATSLIGAHYFGSPQLAVGPSVTVVTDDERVARLLGERFEELWGRAHDVAPAIQEVLRRTADSAGPTSRQIRDGE